MGWLWHKYVLRHEVIKRGAIKPDYRTGGINVYVQDEFRAPMAHHRCVTCERTWL